MKPYLLPRLLQLRRFHNFTPFARAKSKMHAPPDLISDGADRAITHAHLKAAGVSAAEGELI